MNASRAAINADAVLDSVRVDVTIVLGVLGRMVRTAAQASMRPHASQTVRGHNGKTFVSYVGRTPDGQAPRVRTGGIVNNIAVAQEGTEAIIGPVALSSHHTDCLARLEFGKHPFMMPALESVISKIPEVWANSVSK